MIGPTFLSQMCSEVAEQVATWRPPAQGQGIRGTMATAAQEFHVVAQVGPTPGKDAWGLRLPRLCWPSHPYNPSPGLGLITQGALCYLTGRIQMPAAAVRTGGKPPLLQRPRAPCPVSRAKKKHSQAHRLTLTSDASVRAKRKPLLPTEKVPMA